MPEHQAKGTPNFGTFCYESEIQWHEGVHDTQRTMHKKPTPHQEEPGASLPFQVQHHYPCESTLSRRAVGWSFFSRDPVVHLLRFQDSVPKIPQCFPFVERRLSLTTPNGSIAQNWAEPYRSLRTSDGTQDDLLLQRQKDHFQLHKSFHLPQGLMRPLPDHLRSIQFGF